MFFYIFNILLSYISLLVLSVPTTMKGILGAAVLAVLGSLLIVWKKPWFKNEPTILDMDITICIITFLAAGYYDRWLPSSKVAQIASIFHFTPSVFLTVTAIILALFSGFIVMIVISMITDKLPKLEIQSGWKKTALYGLLSAVVTLCLTQVMVNTFIFAVKPMRILVGVLIVFIVIVLTYAISGNFKLSIGFGTGLFIVLAGACAYTYAFRNRMFEPVDVFAIGTAANVAEEYSLWPIPKNFAIGLFLWIVFLISIFKQLSRQDSKPSIKQRLNMLLGGVVSAVLLFLYAFNITPSHWSNVGAIRNGLILNFVSEIEDAFVFAPEDYNIQNIKNLENQYTVTTKEGNAPHIIVIMNESFSDLSVNGKLNTNSDVTPFVSQLIENTISGKVLVSVNGGNTANSEFEFLTGNSMAWMSENSVPYQQYVKTPSYSMVSYLKSIYGYKNVAMHPYYPTGWNRPQAYTNFGFDEMYFIEDFPNKKLVRNYVSDQEMYEKVIETYEKNHEEPLFLFGVTMQNHGPYTYSGPNFTPSITLIGYNQPYPDAELYLSMIHESDKALEYLIDYFSNVDEDVVIVFFGDHQPSLDEDFYEELSGGDTSSLEIRQKRYLVPFFIWTNYDIEEKELEQVSLNYLSSYVYEAAGIPEPPYNKFLLDMKSQIPAMNVNGFYSQEKGKFVTYEEASKEEQKWLNAYEQLQYNNLFDKDNRSGVFFPIN